VTDCVYNCIKVPFNFFLSPGSSIKKPFHIRKTQHSRLTGLISTDLRSGVVRVEFTPTLSARGHCIPLPSSFKSEFPPLCFPSSEKFLIIRNVSHHQKSDTTTHRKSSIHIPIAQKVEKPQEFLRALPIEVWRAASRSRRGV
jgi:hypothetical protein